MYVEGTYIRNELFFLSALVETDTYLLKKVLDIGRLRGTSLEVELSSDFIGLFQALSSAYLAFTLQIAFITDENHNEVKGIRFIQLLSPVVHLAQRFVTGHVEHDYGHVGVSEVHRC